jgi:hypothetical protein
MAAGAACAKWRASSDEVIRRPGAGERDRDAASLSSRVPRRSAARKALARREDTRNEASSSRGEHAAVSDPDGPRRRASTAALANASNMRPACVARHRQPGTSGVAEVALARQVGDAL